MIPALGIGPHRARVPLVLAPMAAVSEAPFRQIALEAGAGFAPTELVSAKGLDVKSRRTASYLRHDPEREPSFWVQLYGGDPEVMARGAARVAEEGARLIDVNMGCPVPKITKNGAGSALLKEPARAASVVAAMVRATSGRVPITVKLRSGWDAVTAPELAKHLEDAGASAIAVHARTRVQGYAGRADWSVLARVVQAVRIPVVANGDVATPEDALRVLRETGCAGVMVGRAALGDPWVLGRMAAALSGEVVPKPPPGAARVPLILRHLRENVAHHESETRAVFRFRQHLAWYARGFVGAEAFRARINGLLELAAVEDAVGEFFERAVPGQAEGATYDERTALG